jgi:hypothetical protein
MNAQENLFLQALDMKLTQLIIDINKREEEEERLKKMLALPEWINLNLAVQLKGGAALDTYKTQYWQQPCCGLRSKRVGGRKVWRREDVMEWLAVSDDGLWEYAERIGAKIPDKYRHKRTVEWG